jgi:hypothetical protein
VKLQTLFSNLIKNGKSQQKNQTETWTINLTLFRRIGIHKVQTHNSAITVVQNADHSTSTYLVLELVLQNWDLKVVRLLGCLLFHLLGYHLSSNREAIVTEWGGNTKQTAVSSRLDTFRNRLESLRLVFCRRRCRN